MRVWFNRTYATATHVIRLLRENPDGEPVWVIGTHADPDSPVLAACDEAHPEPGPGLADEEYVAWALAFCRRHRVDVLVPRLQLAAIAAARSAFEAAGVAVVAGPTAAATLLDDKAAAYADAASAGLAVPPHHVVRTGDDLLAAFAAVRASCGERTDVVLKPVRGVGAEGYRVLTDHRPTLAEVTGELTPLLHVDDAAGALEAHRAGTPGGAVDGAVGREVPPLMVMPYLTGPEVSVDCLGDVAGALLAAVPRTKVGRRRMLADDPAAVAVAASIVDRHRLGSLSNTQVRYWRRPDVDDRPLPYLLETNVRMSGGLHQTALAGVNLPWAAVQQARGRDVVLPAPRLGVAFTTVSSVVPLAPAGAPGAWSDS